MAAGAGASAARVVRLVVATALVVGAGACGDSDDGGTATTATSPTTGAPTTAATQRHPDVLAATADRQPDGTWNFTATLSSPYDTADRYADAWRVVTPDGQVLGVRELLHDHAGEQPFTRSLDGVTVPTDIDTVTVQGRDRTYGWGGATVILRIGS